MRQTSTNVWAISNKFFSCGHPSWYLMFSGFRHLFVWLKKRIIETISLSTLEDFANLVMLECSSKIISKSCFGQCHEHDQCVIMEILWWFEYADHHIIRFWFMEMVIILIMNLRIVRNGWHHEKTQVYQGLWGIVRIVISKMIKLRCVWKGDLSDICLDKPFLHE